MRSLIVEQLASRIVNEAFMPFGGAGPLPQMIPTKGRNVPSGLQAPGQEFTIIQPYWTDSEGNIILDDDGKPIINHQHPLFNWIYLHSDHRGDRPRGEPLPTLVGPPVTGEQV